MASSLVGSPKEKWIRSFTVTDPTKHEKGFTVYKVTYRAFCLNKPDDIIEVTVWKRYNDFKKLHKALSALHFHLRRPEKFPEFAKAKFFGRFDDQVIEERRQSALRLLEFAATIPPLSRNTYFSNFFQGGEEITKKVPSQRTSILQPHIITPVESGPIQADKVATTSEEGEGNVNEGEKTSGTKNGFTPPLGGIWLHRQAEDEAIDYGDLGQLDDDDDDDDRTTFSEDSVPSNPLPQLQDLSIFDPLAGDTPASSESGTLPHSNSWLFHAMDMCAELNQDGTESPQEGGNSVTDTSTDSGITINFSTAQTTPSDVSVSDSAISSATESNLTTPSTPVLPSPDISSKLDPLDSKERRSSMARAYLNSIRAQQAASIDSADGLVDSRAGTSTPEKKPRTSSTYSASDLEIGGVEDYLYQAARHISMALDNEANGNYQSAFDLYKEGVGILLKGVIGDNNKTRREAVRRKTAQYLMKAEDLYNKYLSAAAANARRWESQQMIVEFDSSSAHLKGPTEDLKNYKVLGIIDRVLLVLDMVSYQTYAIKVLRKYSVANKNRKTIIPADCPYMVKLFRYFETDCSIFLVLEHATGGKLWTYASAYLHHDLTNKVPFVCSLERSGSKRSRTSGSIGGLEERVRRISGGEDNVFDNDSPTKSTGKANSRIDNVESTESVQPESGNVKPFDDFTTLESNVDSRSTDDAKILQLADNNILHKKIEADDAELSSATPPLLSESPEVASSYANIFSDYTKKAQTTRDSSEDFMHIEDAEETGSNLNDLVQASSQYGDITADVSNDSLGLGDQSNFSVCNDSVFSSDDPGSHNKSFNSTVQQVNTQPPPMTLFSIDSSESPDVQSVESLDRPLFHFSSDNKDMHGSLEGLGQLQEETENGGYTSVAKNQGDGVWQEHNPDNVIDYAMQTMQELEQDNTDIKSQPLDTVVSRDLIPHRTKDTSNNEHAPLDTSGFGVVFEDSALSTPGMDLAEFFDNSKDSDRPRALSSPPQSSQGNLFYSNPKYAKRTASVGNDQDITARTTSSFIGIMSSSSGLSFGHKNSFGSSEPKSSLEDLLEPSDTNEIESEWEKSAKTSKENRTDLIKSNQDENIIFARGDLNNGANTLSSEQSTEAPISEVPSIGQIENANDKNGETLTNELTPEVGALSDNGSMESSTTAKELPSSIYSSTQSTPKHSSTLVDSKMADWPGDVQTDVHTQIESARQYGMSGNVPSALESTDDGNQGDKLEQDSKPKLPETRLPSLSTFLAQMDEATAKHASLTTLPESCVRMWAVEIVVALASLHSKGIICKDLRPHNILLAEGGHIRLTYFSQWKYVEPELDYDACEHFYTAPEVKGVYDVTEACDWWSLGAILFELLTSKSLYTCHPSGINSHTQLNVPDHVSTEAKGLLAQLLQVNPLERLGSGRSGVDDIKAHPFFHGINWSMFNG